MTDQMNVVFLMPDQLRPDFLSSYGADFIHTPHIDSLCAGGTRYARAISPSPLCVPMRASLLTGQNTIRTGVLNNYSWLRPDHAACGAPTWPALLAAVGYTTAGIGKMHFYPWDISAGFAYRVIAEDKRHIHIQDDYFHYLQRHGHTKYHGNEHAGYHENKGAIVSKIPAEHQVDTWVADQACAFIAQCPAETPFAMMVGFPGPHCPYDPPPELAAMFDPEKMPPSIPATADSAAFNESFIAANLGDWNQVDYRDFTEAQKRKIRAYYAALVHQIDVGIGRILETLRAAGHLEDTVIIFGSDHGDYLGDYGFVGKGTFFEPSIHVPLIVHDPRVAQTRVVAETVSFLDVFAAILHAADVPLPPDSDAQLSPGSDRRAGGRHVHHGRPLETGAVRKWRRRALRPTGRSARAAQPRRQPCIPRANATPRPRAACIGLAVARRGKSRQDHSQHGDRDADVRRAGMVTPLPLSARSVAVMRGKERGSVARPGYAGSIITSST